MNLLLPEVDAIIHLAGKAHDTKNKSEAQTYFDINVGLTQKIFDYYLQSKAGQFILQHPESGIYHLADDEPVSTNELIELIAKTC